MLHNMPLKLHVSFRNETLYLSIAMGGASFFLNQAARLY
jgi:hypothetical protein